MTDSHGPPIRTWPEGRELSDAECIQTSCAACGIRWRIHDRLSGFRMKCSCGEWLDVPGTEQQARQTSSGVPQPVIAEQPQPITQPRVERDDDGLMHVPEDNGEVIYSPMPTDAPLAPGAMHRASNQNRTRWTNRTFAEFLLLMGALLGPQLIAAALSETVSFGLLLPFASLLSGVLVAMIAAWGGPYGRIGMRPARSHHFVEAIVAAAIGIVIAVLYTNMLERMFPDAERNLDNLTGELGLIGSLFVIAVTPAILEEIIFRGFLQGRLMALFGRLTGMLITASAFALVHGQPAVLPIHLGIGLYLGWLKERSGSLLPGMLMHFLYNGTLVALTFQLL